MFRDWRRANDLVTLPQPQLIVFGGAPTTFHKLKSSPIVADACILPVDVLALIDPKRDGTKIEVKREGRDLVIAPRG